MSLLTSLQPVIFQEVGGRVCQKCVPQPRPVQNEDLTEYKPSPEEHQASTEEASASASASAEYKGYDEDPPSYPALYREDPPSYPARTILALLRGHPALPGTWDNTLDTTETGVRHHNNVFDNTHFEYDLFK